MVKSTDVYRIVRNVPASWCKEHGFKRTKGGGLLGWYKPVADQFIVFWFKVSPRGWDDESGSKFILEFQISDDPIIGDTSRGLRRRFPKFLTDDELAQVAQIQNCVIAKVHGPRGSLSILRVTDKIGAWWRKTVEYQQASDIWLRYKDEEDVERWANFVKDKMPALLQVLSEAAVNKALPPVRQRK